VSWRDNLPTTRGRILRDEPLAPFTWFRVGGPAEVLFLPADEADLATFLAALPPEVPVTVLGVGSNVIVRDGGVEGVVIRLGGRGFGDVHIEAPTWQVAAGSAALDAMVARAAAKSGVAGLEFYAGIPGSIGGAITMNAGCYGSETKDVLQVAWGVTRQGESKAFSPADLGYSYRHSVVPEGEMIWTGAVFQGVRGEPETIRARIDEITAKRETTQPIRDKTGGSTFKNPAGESAWRLVDAAGWRGKPYGGAMFSPLHANFMLNTGGATAADLEGLGDTVREAVAKQTGVTLEWEIKRIGKAV
jgi:UDP-N-acetylmuramate dehydrogenase